MKEEEKGYQRNKKKLEYILGHKDLKAILSQKRIDMVKRAFQLMKKGMDWLVDNEEPIEVSGQDKSRVKEVLNLLLSLAIGSPMRPILKDLVLEFGLLAHNWNQAYGKRPDIVEVIVNAKNVVYGNLSLIQSIGVMKNLLARLEKLQRFTPPAFELSKAYIKALEKKGGDEEDVKV